MKQPIKKPIGFDVKEQEFCNELRDYIHRNEAFVTSEPHTNTIRFECLPQSSLPQLLDSRGFDVVNAGTATRLMPSTVTEARGNQTFVSHNVVPTVMDVWRFQLFAD